MKEFKFAVEDNLITLEVNDFCEVASNCVNLYSKKNHDYGNSFDKGMDNIGMPYGVGRIYDKVNRLITLIGLNQFNKPQITNESIDDTLMDLACYSIMMLAYRKREKEKERSNIEFN